MLAIYESPFMQELRQEWFEQGIKQGIKRGVAQGLEQGEHRTRIETIAQILAIRFQVPLGEFDKKLESLDTEILKELVEVALTAEALEQFEIRVETALRQLKGEENTPSKGREKRDGQI